MSFGLRLVFAIGIASSVVLACNAIVGVEEVRLRKTKEGSDADDTTPTPSGTDDGSTTPTDDHGLISIGGSHACARLTTGKVTCWGANDVGQLGDGLALDAGSRKNPALKPQPVPDLTGVIDIGAGFKHTCVVKSDNTVACWGYNDYGQLGNGSMATATAPTANGVTGATAITSGTSYSCALLQDKTVTCWGANYGGQLGNGDPAQVPNSQPSPVKVVALTNAKQISAGTSHTCAVDGDGKAWCWGSNFYGQLGNGSTTATSTPQPITSLTGVVQISAGNFFTCALSSTHQVSCWGVNDHGQLGNGAVSDTSTPNPSPNVVPNLNDAVYVWAGGENHACAIRQGGAIACWGDADSGQLGVSGVSGAVTKPVQIVQPTTATSVATGANTSCAITTDGRGYCWGSNMNAQIGDGTVVNRPTPTQISNFP